MSDTAPGEVRHRGIFTNGIELFAAEAGPEDGPPVVLLHGFPEFWYGWRHQIGPLAAAGYHVVAPDQRGYHISDKPRKLRDYRLDRLAGDVVGILDDLDTSTAAIVGHDWGGIVAWWLALTRPDRVDKLVILNAPHPQVMRQALRSSREQRRRSRYFLTLQLPWLPERKLARDRHAALRQALEGTAREGTFSEEDFERYQEAWSAPGALTGMLSWYRAMRFPTKAPQAKQVDPETLVIWGTQDRFLGEEMLEPSVARCRDGRALRLDTAGHWVQHEEPARVTDAILEFLGDGAADDRASGRPWSGGDTGGEASRAEAT